VPDIVRGLPEISKYISMISSDSKNSNPSDVIKNYLADTYEKLNKKSDWREYNVGRAQAKESIEFIIKNEGI
jgi:hypothetical protein